MDDYARTLLAAHPEILEVIVFGSFTKGNYAPGSDIDIFILLSDSGKPIRDRIPDFLPRSFPVGVDIFPYTTAEVESIGRNSLLDAVRDSVWRYTRPVA